MDSHPKIVLVGTGRIAWHIGKRLKGKGLPVAQVLGRNEERTRELAEALNCQYTFDPKELIKEANWILMAVSDDAIKEVAGAMAGHVNDALVTHTSGGTPGGILAPYFPRFGVFYPLQSFSMEHMPVWSKIPFCVDAVTEADVLFLKKVAKTIGNLVYQVNDAQRAYLHVAAVFANNFANHCFAIAEKILDDRELPFELLHPLMEETLAKALQDSPLRMQTGPAIRGDSRVVQRHISLLEGHADWQELYKKLSLSINGDLKME